MVKARTFVDFADYAEDRPRGWWMPGHCPMCGRKMSWHATWCQACVNQYVKNGHRTPEQAARYNLWRFCKARAELARGEGDATAIVWQKGEWP